MAQTLMARQLELISGSRDIKIIDLFKLIRGILHWRRQFIKLCKAFSSPEKIE